MALSQLFGGWEERDRECSEPVESPGWGLVSESGLRQCWTQAQPNIGTAAQRNRDTHTHMGPEAETKQMPQMQPHCPWGESQLDNGTTWTSGQTDGNTRGRDRHRACGTNAYGQTETRGTSRPNDTRHARQRHKDGRKSKSDLATLLPQPPFCGLQISNAPSPDYGGAGWGFCRVGLSISGGDTLPPSQISEAEAATSPSWAPSPRHPG